MARTHGAKRVTDIIKRYAKTHGISHRMVPASVIRKSVSTMPRCVPKVMPGTKIEAAHGEPVELLLQRLRKAGKTGGRTGKGTVVFTSDLRRTGRRRRASRPYKPYDEILE